MNLQNSKDRHNYIRSLIVEMISVNNRGHYGSAMSLVELLSFLYDEFMVYDPLDPNFFNRDRLILSKGHGCLALYSLLADKGFFDINEINNFSKFDSFLAGHPEKTTPGIEASTGSLGHGLAVGVGIAVALKLKKIHSKVIVILGDGELNEGSIWESALHASKHQLDNLYVFVDYNKIQSYGFNDEVCNLEPLKQKWESFGFIVDEFDGHNYQEISSKVKRKYKSINKPYLFLSHTIKGKGYPDAENNPLWHHKNFNDEEMKALKKYFK